MLTCRRSLHAVTLAVCVGLGPAAIAQTAAPAAISERDLREWLTYISSDALQGRQAYSEGLGLAATYIASHLERWGLQPAGDDNTYLQTVHVKGVRTTSRSSVTVTVNGQSRTFKDGEGVRFPRNQGKPQAVTGTAAFSGYGVTFAPLQIDDYGRRDMRGKVVIFLGRTGPKGFTDAHNSLLRARGRVAIDTHHAIATITQDPGDRQAPAPAQGARRVDFQTAQRLDNPIVPQISANDDFFTFLFSASGVDYQTLKAAADNQEALPAVTLDNVTVAINVDADYDIVQTRLTRNVVARIAGSDPALAGTHVLLGAHYDHIGYEQFELNPRVNLIASCPGQTRPLPRPGDRINNGADDDGSGTVVLMALARAFASGPRPKQSLLFVWHTAEEGGLAGSRYMTDYPVVPLDRIGAELNIDMVGRNSCDNPADVNTVYVVGSDRISTELHNVNEAANTTLPQPLTLDYALNDPADLETLYTRSDHFSYASKGIPIIFFTTGLHRDYHYVTDEIDRIEFGKMARIAGLVYGTASRLANLDHMPVRDNLGPRRGRGSTGPIAVD